MKAKLTCGIIEDILPNFIDGLTGEESNMAIKEHLDQCESCRKKLEVLDCNIPIDKPPQKEIEPFKKIKRVGITLISVVFVIGIIIGIISVFAAERNMDEALWTLVLLFIGAIIITFRFIVPVVGIYISVTQMKKRRDIKKIIPIGLIVFFSLWLLYSISIVIYNILKYGF